MFTGLVRALIQTCHESVLQGRSYLPIRQEIVRVSHWQAARYGLEAFLLDPLSGEIVAARQLLDQFLHYAHAALQSQGSWELVSKAVETIVQQGTGATRQRQVYQQTNSFQQVVNFVVKETARGT